MRDPRSFHEFFQAHAEALRRYAERIVRSRAAAEDVVQEAFFRVWRMWDRVEAGPNVRAYLYMTVRSRALSHLERERREERRHLHLVRGIRAEEPALPPEGESKVERDEIARAIELVLGRMPMRQREVAALRLRHQLTTAEIAARLGISPRTVEVHIARATRALRDELPALLGPRPAGPIK